MVPAEFVRVEGQLIVVRVMRLFTPASISIGVEFTQSEK